VISLNYLRMGYNKMKNKDQEMVLELIGKNARGIMFVDFLDIDLRNVKTSSLHLFYKVMDRNTQYLLAGQRIINGVLSIRAKEAQEKMAALAMVKETPALEKLIKSYKAGLKSKIASKGA